MYGIKIYFYSGLFTSLLLIPIYVVVLSKAKNGTNYKFVTGIIWLLILSNIGQILFLASNYFAASYWFNLCVIVVLSISKSVQDATFNVAHWLFAMEYYSISRSMPYVVKQQPVP
jgi:hypothetical protein